MGAFSQVEMVASARKPVHTRIVPPSAFSDAWKGRPKAPVCAGFRVLSLDDVRSIRAAASEEGWRLHPRPLDEENRNDAIADAIMRLAIARSACDPNDVDRPWAMLGTAADDNVAIVLSTDGVRALYLDVDLAAVASGATFNVADDSDLLELFDLLPLAFERMPTERATTVRKWLGFLLEQCRAFVPPEDVVTARE